MASSLRCPRLTLGAALKRPVFRRFQGIQGSLCNIFTLWDFEKPSLFHALVLQSWRRHTRGYCNEPVVINERNARSYVPDLPEEYFRLPYPAAKADLLRYGLLYHHGGLFVENDVLAGA